MSMLICSHHYVTKKTVSARKQRSPKGQENVDAIVQQGPTLRKQPTSRSITRKPSALGDRTVQTRNAENSRAGPLDKSVNETDRNTGSVRNRMREWELERARLREMERVGESDNQQEEERPVPVRKPSRLRDNASPVTESPNTPPSPTKSDDLFAQTMSAKLFKPIREATVSPAPTPPLPVADEVALPMREPFTRNASANESSLSLLKQSLKFPLGKTVELYKSSIGLIGRRQSAANSSSPQELSERPSWEREILHEANSSLPAVQQAVRNRRVGADSRADRMTIWLQNVEKVVSDARQNFASSNISLLPPLPVAPGPQTRRPSRDRSYENSCNSTRLSRKAPAANQIFHLEEDSSVDQSGLSLATSAQNDSAFSDVPPAFQPGGPSRSAFSFDSPRPTRRATVLGRSPETSRSLDIDVDMTPSKRREKSKSANDLKRLIRPISKVQFELDKLAAKSRSLSTVLDRNLFTPDPITPADPDTSESSSGHVSPQSPDRDSLMDSPFVVQPYPTRKQLVPSPAMDSPTQRHVEGVYDRFLMATSGVKRVGKGYQSSHVKPVSTSVSSSSSSRSPGKFFHSTRRPMPPPVSSEDKFAEISVDELGVMQPGSTGVDTSGLREDRAGASNVVGRALKALVAGKTVVKKPSRARY
ncbi:hypothetical protein EDB85DRAFT_617178 [Lactarius pseudohatsudake]|nr:hypothetical protein EDB85DRAFT_617178 [Lactarius pseudohatsudake]